MQRVQFRPFQNDLVPERSPNGAGQDKRFQPVTQAKTIVDVNPFSGSNHNQSAPTTSALSRNNLLVVMCVGKFLCLEFSCHALFKAEFCVRTKAESIGTRAGRWSKMMDFALCAGAWRM